MSRPNSGASRPATGSAMSAGIPETDAMIMLPPIDGFGHKLHQEWALSTGHLLMRAGHTAKLANFQQLQNKKEMSNNIRVTMQAEAKVCGVNISYTSYMSPFYPGPWNFFSSRADCR